MFQKICLIFVLLLAVNSHGQVLDPKTVYGQLLKVGEKPIPMLSFKETTIPQLLENDRGYAIKHGDHWFVYSKRLPRVAAYSIFRDLLKKFGLSKRPLGLANSMELKQDERDDFVKSLNYGTPIFIDRDGDYDQHFNFFFYPNVTFDLQQGLTTERFMFDPRWFSDYNILEEHRKEITSSTMQTLIGKSRKGPTRDTRIEVLEEEAFMPTEYVFWLNARNLSVKTPEIETLALERSTELLKKIRQLIEEESDKIIQEFITRISNTRGSSFNEMEQNFQCQVSGAITSGWRETPMELKILEFLKGSKVVNLEGSMCLGIAIGENMMITVMLQKGLPIGVGYGPIVFKKYGTKSNIVPKLFNL